MLVATLFSCSGNEDGGQSTCRGLVNKYESCGLTFKPANVDPCLSTPPDSCTVHCYDNVTCADLQKLACSEMELSKNDPFIQCAIVCQAAKQVKCGVGDETYGPLDKYDGFQNCSNNAYEAGCKQFACGDGSSVPENAKCDGEPNCSNSADEVGCPAAAPEVELFCPNGKKAGEGNEGASGGSTGNDPGSSSTDVDGGSASNRT